MSWDFFSAPFTAIINGISGYFGRSQEIKENQNRRDDELAETLHLAEIERIKRGDETERDYDIMAMENAKASWIDEIMVLWILGIVTALFIPSLSAIAITGFNTLTLVPVWFQTVFVGCFIAKLGLRFLFSGRTLFGSKVK